jgi:hypothetical protein
MMEKRMAKTVDRAAAEKLLEVIGEAIVKLDHVLESLDDATEEMKKAKNLLEDTPSDITDIEVESEE